MKGLKILSAATAAFMAVTSLVASVSAQAKDYFSYVDELSGISFTDITAYELFLGEFTEEDRSLFDKDLRIDDTIYILKGYEDKMKGIIITPTYVSTGFSVDDNYCRLLCYNSKEAYEIAAASDDDNSAEYEGISIYWNSYPTGTDYFWKQGGEYFCLKTSVTEGADNYLYLCNAEEYPVEDGEYLDEREGLIWDEGKLYYYNEDGTFHTGWKTVKGNRYFFKKSGEAALKSTVISGVRYRFGSDGICKGKYTGWTTSTKGRKYFKNGVMYKNKWVKTKSGTRYYLTSTGYSDEWGLSMKVKNVTDKGLEVVFRQYDGSYRGSLETGAHFYVEKKTSSGSWKELECVYDGMVFTDEAYMIAQDGETSMKQNWENFYGKLSKGTYRIVKPVMDFVGTGVWTEREYSAEFTIK